jgi:hypothetical protein
MYRVACVSKMQYLALSLVLLPSDALCSAKFNVPTFSLAYVSARQTARTSISPSVIGSLDESRVDSC